MEKKMKPMSGWGMLVIELLLIAFIIYAVPQFGESIIMVILGVIAVVVTFFTLFGFMAIEPNNSRVLTLFGKYVGTVKDDGFFWVNPFYSKKSISLRANNLDTKPIKVNDKHGNPIMIGAVVVWKVADTFKAAFDVDKYQSFVEIQIEAAIRRLAGAYSYDNHEGEIDGEVEEITLRSSSADVNDLLENEISERLVIAGINIIEARISHLAYATEIAGAMLQRQQASAVIAARSKIVAGAVGMVEMALEELSKKKIVDLDEEKKATMVSNLLVVLCSDKAVSPVVNTGTLYQ
jgi:regulator of protease activity HflC (stomatin/prohibitin superfamily)